MGSVRRATWKGYLPFLALNVVISAVTVILVLALWGGSEPEPVTPPTPTFDVAARVASAVPTSTATIPPSPTPVTYTVEPGDTLGAIAAELNLPVEALMAANGLTNPDTLTSGQVLLIPSIESDSQPAQTEQPETQATKTPDPSEQDPQVMIQGAYERGELEREFVYLENLGGVAMMRGWTLDDGEGHRYEFPSFTLYNGGGVNIYTREGIDSVINLFWGMDRPLWEAGKVITLRDAEGEVHATFQLPEA